MAETVKLASPVFRFVLRYTLGTWLKLRFRVHYHTTEISGIAPPFFVIGNHSFNWDGFLVSLPFDRFVHFVASDEYFRFKPLQFLLKAIGGIPKTKNTSDSSVVRNMLSLKKLGAIIGIYPEGNRNWDGVTGPLYSSTAKVIKKFKIPVISCITTGSSLIHPRWAKHTRSGPLFMDYQLLFTPEQISQLSDTEIEEIMITALAHDDHPDATARASKESLPFQYKGKKLAEKLELFLFQCPKCLCPDTMASKNNRFFCKECGFSVTYENDAKFHNGILQFEEGRKTYHRIAQVQAVQGDPPFTTTKDWNRWQCNNLEQSIIKNRSLITTLAPGKNHLRDTRENTILENENAFLKTGKRTGLLNKIGFGTLSLRKDQVIFVTEPNSPTPTIYVFPVQKITGLNIQYNNKVEFYFDNTLYRFAFPLENISIWKWHQAILYSQKLISSPENKENH